MKPPITKIVPIDKDLEKDTLPETDQKVIGAMVEMLNGLDQRLNKYFDESDPEKYEVDEQIKTRKFAPKDRGDPKQKS